MAAAADRSKIGGGLLDCMHCKYVSIDKQTGICLNKNCYTNKV